MGSRRAWAFDVEIWKSGSLRVLPIALVTVAAAGALLLEVLRPFATSASGNAAWMLLLSSLTAAGLTILLNAYLPSREARNEYKALVEHAVDVVFIVSPEDHRLIYTNIEFQRRLNLSEVDALKLHIEDVFVLKNESAEGLNQRLRKTRCLELRMHTRGAASPSIEVQAYLRECSIRKRPVWAYTVRDVTQQKLAESQLLGNQQRLDHMAHHDQLTGLPNRHYMTAFLPEMLRAAKSAGRMLAVVFLDLDRFKYINDTQGHHVGDILLQEVSNRLRNAVRGGDCVIRMGGDEFVVILDNVQSHQEVLASAARIEASLREPIVVNGARLQTTASIGVSVYPQDGQDMAELLKHSDTAMYQAKDRGRNNVQIFTSLMDRALKRRVAVEAMLREAIASKHLDVYYQPLMKLATREVVGLEALIRWRHPTRGMIPPDWFISVAEETGLIVPMGNFVLHRVFQDMVKWRNAGVSLVCVSLNVAPAQLIRGEFRSKIASLLSSHQIRPELLQLEMTERTVFDIASATGAAGQDSIAGLRDLGVQIAIDDFGTGYSSLSYLKNWRVDKLKIDKSFVRDLAIDSSDYAIVSAIVAMARHLRIEVIAEGIEAFQQAEILRNIGCHQGQGYLFSRPLSADKMTAYLLREPTVGYEEDDMIGTRSLATDVFTAEALRL